MPWTALSTVLGQMRIFQSSDTPQDQTGNQEIFMLLHVESIEKGPKSYKLKANGSTYFAGFKVKGIEQTTGKAIEAVITKNEYQGRTYNWIDGFTVEEGSTAVPTASVSRSTDRWYMPYVSNVCAHAIAAGLIKEPADLQRWALGAKAAAEVLDDPFGMETI
jgi:hypothetical protein